MKEKLTPDKIDKFLLFVENQIRFMEKDIDAVETFGSVREGNVKSMAVNILEKELEKLKNDLEVFRNTDVDDIKNNIYGEKFMVLLKELK